MNNLVILLTITLLAGLTLACSGFSIPTGDSNLPARAGTATYQPAAKVYQELRSLYNDPNQTRFLSYDRKAYEYWGRVNQITVERLAETEEEFWSGTGDPVALVSIEPDIVCSFNDVGNRDLQALQVGQIAVLKGEFNAELSFSESLLSSLALLGIDIESDDAIFNRCEVVVVDYDPPTPTPKPTTTLRYGIGDGPMSVEEYLDLETTRTWTQEEAYGLKVGGVFNSQCGIAPGVDYTDLDGLIIVYGEACLMIDNMEVRFPESNPARPRLGSKVYVRPLDCFTEKMDETGQSEPAVILIDCDSIEVMN